MVKAAPSSAFVVAEPDLLFEVLIIALDAPAQFGEIDQPAEADALRQVREPVLCRCFSALRPLDQQPLVRLVVGQSVTVAGSVRNIVCERSVGNLKQETHDAYQARTS